MNEDEYGSIGFMFDAEKSRIVYEYDFSDYGKIFLQTIGDDPGHLQSGSYVWPAAFYAANYFISHWNELQCDHVLELGAGCGLTGILVSRLPSLKSMIFTDYDSGCIGIINQNIAVNKCSTCEYFTIQMKWGESFDFPPVDMIIGSDLLYSKDIVEPLFCTVHLLLQSGAKLFVLISSFDIGQVVILPIFDENLLYIIFK